MVEPFFFPTAGGQRLFGVWRQGKAAPQRVWVICPPFAEEEKSARRTLTEVAQALSTRNEAVLVFSYRGTGDSDAAFSEVTLDDWRADIQAAVAEARRRAPQAEIGLIGLRLGGALALQEAEALQVSQLILLEPLLSGRSFVAQMNARKKLRAQMTEEQGGAAEAAAAVAALPYEDLDGWPFTAELKESLSKLDIQRQPVAYKGQTLVVQVGPKAELTPPLQALAQTLNARTQTVVMPPFWNLLDYAPSGALVSMLESHLSHA